MKKMILSLATIAAMSTSALAADSKFYAGAGFAIQNLNIDGLTVDLDAGNALVIRGGMNLDNVTKGLGVEVEYSNTMTGAGLNNIEYKFTNIALYATYGYEVVPKLKVIGKVGFATSQDTVVLGTTEADGDGGSGLAYGAGVAYEVIPNVSATVDYTIYSVYTDASISNLTIGANYAF